MTRWEYRLARLKDKGAYDFSVIALDEKAHLVELKDRVAGEFVNELGAEGWELVSVTMRSGGIGNLYLLWFKRPIAS